MDEHNPPMAMPNGSVYSLHAMEQMARPRNHSGISQPPTTAGSARSSGGAGAQEGMGEASGTMPPPPPPPPTTITSLTSNAPYTEVKCPRTGFTCKFSDLRKIYTL